MQTKYKIMLASETYPPDVNGAAMFVQRLANLLAMRGHEVLVLAPSTNYMDRWETPAKNLKVFRIKSVPLRPIHPYFRVTWKGGLTGKIRKAVQDFRPDIIHIHNHFLLGRTCLKIAGQNGIPIIGTNHFMPDNLTEYFPKVLEKTISRYMWRGFIKIYNRLDYVTAPTHVALKMIRDLGLKVPSSVISNGIALDEFKKEKIDKKIYGKFHLRKDMPIFLFVGRLERDKNIDLVLKAVDINKDKLKFQMVIAGKGNDEADLRKLAKKMRLDGKVIFTGKVSYHDLKQLYSIAKVYLGSGSAELQGLAVMEAMASGLPILAANAVALPELVKNGQNGYLFELDPHILAKKMSQIIAGEGRLKEMSRQSLKLIMDHDENKTAESFTKLYSQVVG